MLETVLDGKYAGFYDPPLLSDYAEIAKLYVQLGQPNMAEKYINSIMATFEKHMVESEKKNKSTLLYSTAVCNAVPIEQICKKLLQNMLGTPELEQFEGKILSMQKRYEKYISHLKETTLENK